MYRRLLDVSFTPFTAPAENGLAGLSAGCVVLVLLVPQCCWCCRQWRRLRDLPRTDDGWEIVLECGWGLLGGGSACRGRRRSVNP